jgi:membrane-bound ClpP family serine protease
MSRTILSDRLRRPHLVRRAIAASFFGAALLSLSAQAPRGDGETDEDQTDKPAQGEDAEQRGYLIRVPLPITGNVDNQIQSRVQRALAGGRKGGPRPILVFQFSPGGSEFGEGSEFSRALDLASFLSSREMAGVKTVAYVPESIKGHAVLAAMACEELVMAPDAEIGEAGVDERPEEPIEPATRGGYLQIANRRRTIPAPVALGMLDKDLEVLRVETAMSGTEYVFRDDLAELRDRQTIESEEVFIRPGEFGRFSGREGRELGFVKYLASDRKAVARALGLGPDALQDDPSLGGQWNAIEVRLEGLVGPREVDRLQSKIGDQLRSGEVNFVLVRIESQGGSLADSMTLANFLAGMDPAAVRTVAYVPQEAVSDAALVAVACDHVVMRPEAILGGEGLFRIPLDEVEAAKVSIASELARRKNRSWSLPVALIDGELVVHRCRNRQTGAVDFFCDEELEEQEAPEDWEKLEQVSKVDVPLEVDGKRALELDLAWENVESFAELKQLYGMENDPRLVESSWADILVDALARPEMATLLLVLGGVAIYAEMQAPGIGIGGFLACVCFLLFFWSKFLVHTATWLEVMLFVGGFCSLLLEIFVLPGFGIFGLGGGMLIILSLVLASQTFVLPSNERELGELRDSFVVVAAASLGIITVGMLVRRYLPHAPMFNRILLQPPQGEGLEDLALRESIVNFSHLMGQRGVVTTQLTPSGKARFGDELIDVISEGDVIDRDSQVVVVEVRGSRVVVQGVERQ